MVVNFLGFLLFAGVFFFLSLIAIFWGFTYYVRRQVNKYEQSQTETHNTFVSLLIHILVKIAQIDGVVTKEETNTIYNFFRYNLRYSQNQLYWVKELMKEALSASITLETLLAEFKNKFAYEPRLILLELIYQVLFTQARPPDRELDLAQTIAEYLDISIYDQQTIRSKYMAAARHTAATEDQYYETLGLAPDADFEKIKRAYRKLSMQYHPDKVGHLGEEFRHVAEEKMKDINVAYQHLKEKFA